MFTVKQEESNGTHIIIQAREVSFFPKGDGSDGLLTPMLVAYGVAGTDATTKFANGDIYVMNENGKTVAAYYLDRTRCH